MMTSLFSLFDPSLSLFSFSWLIVFLVVLMFPIGYWCTFYLSSIMGLFLGLIKSEVDYSLSVFMKGVFSFVGSIFFVVFVYNFLALFPFVFSVTSHILFTLPFSYTFWFSVIFFGWYKSFSNFLAHLVPLGTPVALMSFMVLVEFLSNLIRPLALTFRLTANMMAGHLLMCLIGSALINFSFTVMFLGSFAQSLLVFMELGVSLIQAYVFSVLLLLYLSEGVH